MREFNHVYIFTTYQSTNRHTQGTLLIKYGARPLGKGNQACELINLNIPAFSSKPQYGHYSVFITRRFYRNVFIPFTSKVYLCQRHRLAKGPFRFRYQKGPFILFLNQILSFFEYALLVFIDPY
ncbi:MAG: hypothetical protein K0R05_3853 [Anaerocolumna sp.]|nr:hypothetical protein [Anaerocolumna sp.]